MSETGRSHEDPANEYLLIASYGSAGTKAAATLRAISCNDFKLVIGTV